MFNVSTKRVFHTAELSLGELVHHKMFGLFEAMSAIEMMDPKMDAGMCCNKNTSTPLTFDTAINVSYQTEKCIVRSKFYHNPFADQQIEINRFQSGRNDRHYGRHLFVSCILA